MNYFNYQVICLIIGVKTTAIIKSELNCEREDDSSWSRKGALEFIIDGERKSPQKLNNKDETVASTISYLVNIV